MAYARKVDGQWSELTGPFRVADLQYPQNWPDLATPVERAALGIVEIEEPPEAPAGAEVIGTNVIGTDRPRRILLTQPSSIADLRGARWALAKAVREDRMGGGCMTALGRVDTDPDSQRKIVGAVTGALIAQAAGAPYAIDWTMSDNRVVAHDGPAMIALGVAVLAHINACQSAGTAARLAIGNAVGVADLAAVDIGAGYPADL